jgi:hypothetical protein
MSGAKNTGKPYRQKPDWRDEPRDNPGWVVFCILVLLALVWLGVRL